MGNKTHQRRRPMGVQARFDRWAAKVMGGLTIIVAIALISKLAVGPVIGGSILLYAGLLLFPLTRVRASFGLFGFTKLRRFGAHVLWMGLSIVGIILMVAITEPWAS